MIILLLILIGGMLWLAILIAQTPNTPIPKPEWYQYCNDIDKKDIVDSNLR